jgi:hypothetical protein
VVWTPFVRVNVSPDAEVAEYVLERALERFPELDVEVGVDHRIECGVEVPDPKHHLCGWITSKSMVFGPKVAKKKRLEFHQLPVK